MDYTKIISRFKGWSHDNTRWACMRDHVRYRQIKIKAMKAPGEPAWEIMSETVR